MKLDDKILEQFDLNPMVEREPVNVMKVSELLDFMEESATRLVTKSNQFFKAEDADYQADCLDIVSNRLNDFVQVFIDLLIFIRKGICDIMGGRVLVTRTDRIIARSEAQTFLSYI